MRILEFKQVASRPARRPGGEPGQDGGPESRALVQLTLPVARVQTLDRYRQAPFVAQLLAIRDQHPQTRERRRAEPAEAAAAYRATARLTCAKIA